MSTRTLLLALCICASSAIAQPRVDGTPHFEPEEGQIVQGSAIPAPEGFAGIEFGWSERRFRRACRRADFELVEREDGRLRCTGAPESLGYPTYLDVRFCDAQLCELEATLDGRELSDKVHYAAYARAYSQALMNLRAQFGAEAARSIRAEDECTAALLGGTSAQCFASEGRARHFWVVGDHEIALKLERSQRRHHIGPELSVVIQTPARLAALSATSD